MNPNRRKSDKQRTLRKQQKMKTKQPLKTIVNTRPDMTIIEEHKHSTSSLILSGSFFVASVVLAILFFKGYLP